MSVFSLCAIDPGLFEAEVVNGDDYQREYEHVFECCQCVVVDRILYVPFFFFGFGSMV